MYLIGKSIDPPFETHGKFPRSPRRCFQRSDCVRGWSADVCGLDFFSQGANPQLFTCWRPRACQCSTVYGSAARWVLRGFHNIPSVLPWGKGSSARFPRHKKFRVAHVELLSMGECNLKSEMRCPRQPSYGGKGAACKGY